MAHDKKNDKNVSSSELSTQLKNLEMGEFPSEKNLVDYFKKCNCIQEFRWMCSTTFISLGSRAVGE